MGVKEFKEKLMNDEAFEAKFANATTPEEVVELAAKEGFTFTVEDVKNNTELTEAELAAAAGGTSIFAKTFFVTPGGSIFAKTYFVTP